MPGGFVSEGNVLRLSPLAKAVASRQSGSANPTTGGVSNATMPQSGGMTPVDNAPPVQITEQELAVLEERASQGDPEALSILEALGVLAGGAAAVGGGYALYRALKNRNNMQGAPITPEEAPATVQKLLPNYADRARLEMGDGIVDAEFENARQLGRDPRTGFTIRPPEQLTGPQGARIPSSTVVTPAPAPQRLLPGNGTIVTPPPQPDQTLYLTDQNAEGRERARNAELEGWRSRLKERFNVKTVTRSIRR